MKHKIDIYIKNKLQELNLKDNQLADLSGISPSQISKFKNRQVSKLSAQAFYSIVTAFNDTLENAIKIVYDVNKIKLNQYIKKDRNAFGTLMLQFETSKNSIQEISKKTGIKETRLNELYYRNGALEAYELILIEKAIGIRTGELFKKLFNT
ncbi:MAG: helix-turn-helix transcriptional regulator [Myroides sp.]|nr:helix-turn-helix transcriptional regulator [Myroides sp.]